MGVFASVTWLFNFISLWLAVGADVTGTNPPIGSCLCVTSSTLSVRDNACGNAIGSVIFDQCFRYTGVKFRCQDVDQLTYDFFQINYENDALAWLQGDFLRNVIDYTQCASAINESKYLIVGDWGEILLDGQDRVAESMATWAEMYSARWIVSTGDNFYPNGIRAWNDPAVNVKWRNVYNAYSSLAGLDWKLSVGNHDYGNMQGEEWNQVELSSHDPQWQLPHLWYDWIDKVGDFAVHWVVIDTEAYGNKVNNYTEMVDWMDRTLQQSTADWLLVVGHRNVFSVGNHGPVVLNLLENLVPIMERNSVDAYICGHDHNLQHIRNQSGSGMDYIVNGAGGALLYRYYPEKDDYIRQTYQMEVPFYSISFGYVALTARRNEILFEFFNDRNEFLYSFVRPRNSKRTQRFARADV